MVWKYNTIRTQDEVTNAKRSTTDDKVTGMLSIHSLQQSYDIRGAGRFVLTDILHPSWISALQHYLYHQFSTCIASVTMPVAVPELGSYNFVPETKVRDVVLNARVLKD